MCGIVGIASSRHPIDLDLLVRQRDTMIHRGPDSGGLWVSGDGAVGFGHRRLAIIDLSPSGHQPMVDTITGNVITFNGEIYNYRELRAELESHGERLASRSDTEVLLAGYRMWGMDVLRRLDGMFAFAIHDPRERRVVIARDRVGEKPLFVHERNGEIRFASELKALFLDPAVQKSVDAISLEEYLRYGYVAGERCLVEGIRKLAPGAWLNFSIERGTSSQGRFWELPAASVAVTSQHVSESQAAEYTDRTDDLLTRAVQSQLEADVPVGVLLSGGLDSSLITAIAAKVAGRSLRTFTVSMRGDGAVDEAPFARRVAAHVGTDHSELIADGSSVELLPMLAAQYDEPIADSSMVPTYLVSKAIREHATVAIGGDGGDELFGGYLRHPIHVRQQELRERIPRIARRVLGWAASSLPSQTRGRTFAVSLAGDSGDSVANVGVIFDPSALRRLAPGAAAASSSFGSAYSRRSSLFSDRASTLQRSTASDFSTYLPDDILVKVDRASMLASLEVRAPFLHRPVVEFALGSLPDAMRATTSSRKVMLRRLARRYLPTDFDSARKQGFSIPLQTWLGTTWRPVVEDVLAQLSGSPLDPSAARRLLSRGPTSANRADRQFAVMMFELWRSHYGIS